MKLTVLQWIKDETVPFVGKCIEFLFRTILFFLPLGVYLFLLQGRSKASSINSISVFTNEGSKFQHIFPGFILVSINPSSFNDAVTRAKASFQAWVNNNKYILAFLFMSTVVMLMALSYIKGGN